MSVSDNTTALSNKSIAFVNLLLLLHKLNTIKFNTAETAAIRLSQYVTMLSLRTAINEE